MQAKRRKLRKAAEVRSAAATAAGETLGPQASTTTEGPVGRSVEEEETEAATASASAEETRSPRAERAEAAVEVSSGEEEFVVAPSRRFTEGGKGKEEEETEGEGQAAGPGAERREGRSKKKHDKPAGCPTGTPLKRKAEAAPSGAGSGGIASWQIGRASCRERV